ncbi:MAG TPA: insulinase family protein [Flavobacteriales bacterium]|jgi:predicted Zn-dependent peptidase|nr:insulinase family protein [Flavobacteriales bacterium]
MKPLKTVLLLFLLTQIFPIMAQKIDYEEFDLPNGLHVILHEDHTAPVVSVGVMYHVGAKDEQPNRTGFAHFFEHLLFEGTKNIPRGKWFEIVSSHGGQNNANTTDDRTYYYEVFPSNNLALGLWMESERMRHAVINQIGVDTQNEVVKEEKRLRYDNQPYGHFLEAIKDNVFTKHPYKHTTIGKMADLDAASLDEFKAFYKKYYVPNNATLVVAGDIDKEEAKKLINKYFATIPKGADIKRHKVIEPPITEERHAVYYDKNIQKPAVMQAYLTPSMKDRDAYALDLLSNYLSNGKSSVLYKKLVDQEKKALMVGAFNLSQEDYGTYIIYAIPLNDQVSLQELTNDIDEEIAKLQTNLISEEDYQKLLNQVENDFVNANTSMQGIANNLARYHVLYGNTDLINKELDIYKSITREDLRNVAKKYLNKNQRVLLEYLPKLNDTTKTEKNEK